MAAEAHPRSRIGEGIDEGFDFWNWLPIALGAVFILQAVSRLRV